MHIWVFDQKSQRSHLESVTGFIRIDSHIGRFQTNVFCLQEFWNIGTVQIGICQTHRITAFLKCDCKIGGYSTFTNTAFITTNNEFVLNFIHPLVDKPAVMFIFVGFTIGFIIKLTHFTCMKQPTFSSDNHLILLNFS